MYKTITEIKGDAVVDRVFLEVLVHPLIHLEVAVCNNRPVCPRCAVVADTPLMATEEVLSVVEGAAVSIGVAEVEWIVDAVVLTVVVEAVSLTVVDGEVLTVVGEWAVEVVLIREEVIVVGSIVDGVILVVGDLIAVVEDFTRVLEVDIINLNKVGIIHTSPSKVINSTISQCNSMIPMLNKAIVKSIKIKIQQRSIIKDTIN